MTMKAGDSVSVVLPKRLGKKTLDIPIKKLEEVKKCGIMARSRA